MVPNGWTLTSLGKLCDINPKKIKKPENGKVSFIAMNQLSEEGQLISHLPREYEEVSKGFTSFKDGDVLVAKITPCFENGKGALVHGLTNGVGFGSTEFHVLRAKENTSPEFIYYLTRAKELRVRGENNMQGSAGHRRVTADYFNAYKVLTPPLPEQRKIAKIISTWDKAISTTERIIDNSKQQKKALMQQLLTGKKRLLDDSGKPFEGEWEDLYLHDIAKIIVSPVDKKIVEGEIPVELCNYTDVYYNTRITNSIEFMKATAKQSEIDKYTLQVNDVIITKDSETPGDIAIPALVSEDLGGTVCGYHLAIIRPNSQLVEGAYLNYLFSMQKTRYYFFTLATGATRFGLSIGGINKAHFTLPPLEEQQRIAAVLTNSDREVELLEQQLADLKQEKKALMQQLLTGKRRVKLDDKEVA
ncbi:Type I restriction modification DNA specificity domain protein [Pseudoalteromonas issachenkonii]|uniref:Type I restriction enzyme, S subunit n=1 Tax=Pseudoalteromonas issachenkonii TaxID=152297 RepID=A0ABN5BXL2_9GAMM|nr:restriction endonuclease subunit S [Pseudoalteromonas issachenkonii]ALQ53659.1 Type I restriction modification DNA specificity domain protein [Pseudoalteromonas issachenkonii]ATC89413.1 type I restriction enzyme, S subunit [Pseudoalteromonas issachenkonii]